MQTNDDKSNPLYKYQPEDFSCYIDYKYMKDISPKEHLKAVDWEVFGFPGRDGTESTIWIGTEGCYTNCHYDTYGFNLVAQIQGRKRWILFPPWESFYLYPTRIPYEESSVFSEVNVKNPDYQQHSEFKKANPYIVILEPGQVLYVPRHWWHYVESLEDSISINTWIDTEEDLESRVSEAITRCLFSTLLGARDQLKEDHQEHQSKKDHKEDNWINPGEEILPLDTNIQLLQLALTMKYGAEEKDKNTQNMLCNALRNIPVRGNDRFYRKKRKFSENLETYDKREAAKNLKSEQEEKCKLDRGDNLKEDLNEELCSQDLLTSSGHDFPYIVIVESKIKEDESKEIKPSKNGKTDLKSKTPANLCKSFAERCKNETYSKVFERLVKSVLHPHVIQTILTQLNQ
ncbi:HSPB1-associated protein 1 homolog isoform X2 [Saccostrea echinata]|nr:HSPB1-associated protein 1 homolog isoform X2 [Saccostrea echinata]